MFCPECFHLAVFVVDEQRFEAGAFRQDGARTLRAGDHQPGRVGVRRRGVLCDYSGAQEVVRDRTARRRVDRMGKLLPVLHIEFAVIA